MQNVSHELKTPATLLMSYLKIAEEAVNKESVLRYFLKKKNIVSLPPVNTIPFALLDGDGNESKVSVDALESNPLLKEQYDLAEMLMEPETVAEYTTPVVYKILVVGSTYQASDFDKNSRGTPYYFTFSESEFEAIQLTKKNHFDLIISDIYLPSMNGFMLKEIIKLFPTYTETPFVFIGSEEAVKDKAHTIIKPLDQNELVMHINLLLKRNASNKNALGEVVSVQEHIDQKILKQIDDFVMANLNNENITAGHIAMKLHYTQRSLSKIVLEITGLSLVQYILKIKLTEACRLIQNKEVRSINEARYAVGIDSISYFNKKFKEQFGISPNKLKK